MSDDPKAWARDYWRAKGLTDAEIAEAEAVDFDIVAEAQEDQLPRFPGPGNHRKSDDPLRKLIDVNLMFRGVLGGPDYGGDPRTLGRRAGGGAGKIGQPSPPNEAFCVAMLALAHQQGQATGDARLAKCSLTDVRQAVLHVRKRHPLLAPPRENLKETLEAAKVVSAAVAIQRDTRDTTGRMMGDPMPGRSALDRRK